MNFYVVLLRLEDIKVLESEIAEIDAGQARRPLVSACSCECLQSQCRQGHKKANVPTNTTDSSRNAEAHGTTEEETNIDRDQYHSRLLGSMQNTEQHPHPNGI